jgi:hypothetical protein
MMENLKDALCILAVLVLLGVVGKMDVDDAVAMERATLTEPTSAQY